MTDKLVDSFQLREILRLSYLSYGTRNIDNLVPLSFGRLLFLIITETVAYVTI